RCRRLMISGISQVSTEDSTPRRSSPALNSSLRRFSMPRRSACRLGPATCRKAVPASVSTTPWRLRSNSRLHSSSSSSRRVLDTAGWLIARASAARWTLPCRATSRRRCRCLSFMRLSGFIDALPAAMQAELPGRHPGITLEEAREVRRLGKAQTVGHLAHRHAGVDQTALGLQHQSRMHHLQSGLVAQPSARGIVVRGADLQLAGITLDGPVFTVMLLVPLLKPGDVLLAPVQAAADAGDLPLAPVQPDQQYLDQRGQHGIAPLLPTLIVQPQAFEQTGHEQMVVVLQQMAMGRGQQPGTHGLRRVLHQGQRQAEDEAIHILGKAEAMYAERGHHLQRRLAETQRPALDSQRGVAMLYIEHLDQVGMLMRVDMPVMQHAAFGDGLHMQQVGCRPVDRLAIQLEDRHLLYCIHVKSSKSTSTKSDTAFSAAHIQRNI